MSSQLNSKRHFLDNLASLYMLWCDLQKFKPILQSNVIINILASKFVAWIQKHALSSSSFQISDFNVSIHQTNQAILEMALKMSSSMKRTTTIKRQDYITKPGQCLKTQKLDTFMRVGHNLERTKVIT